MPRALPICLLTCYLFVAANAIAVQSIPTEVNLTPEHILKQELLLNQLIVNIHLLQIDFQNSDARNNLEDSLAQLNLSIPNLPSRSKDKETSELLAATLTLWPVISKHTNWMGELPTQSSPPEVNTLLLALAKLDRQLLLLRQKMLNRQPQQGKRLKLLEQALLMQKLSREYLSLVIREQKDSRAVSARIQLQTLAQHFDLRLRKLNSQYEKHPHAARPIRQAQAAWRFIESTIKQFPDKPIPETIAHYSDRIVSRLTSVSQMF